MWGETKQASSATTALIYITLGSLISVWMVIYYLYLRNHNGSDTAYLYVAGFFCSGVVLFVIGLAVGRIGNASRPAETAPVPAPQVIAQNTFPANGIPAAVEAAPVMAQPAMVTPPAAQPVPPTPTVRPVTPSSPSQLVPNA